MSLDPGPGGRQAGETQGEIAFWVALLATIALALLFSFASAAETIGLSVVPARVTAVYDGDTFTAQMGDGSVRRIRLAGIDAPERCQPGAAQCTPQSWAKEAGDRLRTLLDGRDVRLLCFGESYGRAVCRVTANRSDPALAQVRAGLAWHATQYPDDQTVADAERYAMAEESARRKRLGVWSQPDPVPPWRWRKGDRS